MSMALLSKPELRQSHPHPAFSSHSSTISQPSFWNGSVYADRLHFFVAPIPSPLIPQTPPVCKPLHLTKPEPLSLGHHHLHIATLSGPALDLTTLSSPNFPLLSGCSASTFRAGQFSAGASGPLLCSLWTLTQGTHLQYHSRDNDLDSHLQPGPFL